MVKIAIAGPGPVGLEIIDGLLAAARHEIDATGERLVKGTTQFKVDYQDRQDLMRALDGVHTVLSFIAAHLDEGAAAQKALIDAAIEAGVKRFAPSEWAVPKYLEDKNKDGKVLEYSLFQPGWFLNFIAGSRQTAKHVRSSNLLGVDHDKGTAVVASNMTETYTLTAIADLVNIVVKAVEYEGEWPKIGGINGNTLSLAEEIAVGEKIRAYEIERLDRKDLYVGVVKSSWRPALDQPSLSEAQKEALSQQIACALLLYLSSGKAHVSDEWNRIFPGYKFTMVEEILVGMFAEDI
ncbi:hypothetical protein N658DRAFT_489026 [Parathielavia hyrcaniae]|uniref:NmrA-like domain-containing protein n=1 Tax=Parathielavia hyrcaniae TaxID=113614 RepID=A0AAN6SXP2_9PEZI|nr:hypothetical protein N658DRAFT_489026 [Parathielavia hyrcaniae]